MEGLKALLRAKPHRKQVWFNEKGEWCFSVSDLHPIVKTREEILGDAPEPAQEPEPEQRNKSKKSKR